MGRRSEVNRENRKKIEQQIITLSEKYRNCCFLVSGREDDRFSSWADFEIFYVAPLERDDVIELITKIPFDNKVKKKFLGTLDEQFYRQHHSFLSSPLLAVMMLMTFNENAIIPSKLTEFYKSAFQTLLTWHDATKDSFERDRTLSVDQFRKVFSTFCLISYYDQVFEFDEDQFRKYIQKALRYHKIEVDTDSVKNDICESANLLQKDGLKYLFVHRSFQEYFAAECSMQVVSGKAKDFLEIFANRPRDSVFAMCYEIHPELVYDQYFKHNFEILEETNFFDSSRLDSNSAYSKWLCQSVNCIFVNSKSGLFLSGLKFEMNDHERKASHIIFLCALVTEKLSKLDTPTDILINIALKTVPETANKARLPRSKGQEIKMEISFNKDSFSLKLRNVGNSNFSSSEIRRFRAALIHNLDVSIKDAEPKLTKYFVTARGLISNMKKERQAKAKSIDEVLGL